MIFNNNFLFYYPFSNRTAGGSMLGDVNISAILDSFSVSYDKRVRPNYGGMYSLFPIYINFTITIAKNSKQKKLIYIFAQTIDRENSLIKQICNQNFNYFYFEM